MKKVILIVIFSALIFKVRAQEKKTYYDNGQLESVGNYVDEKKEGEWINYHEIGQLRSIGTYTLGQTTGEWKFYFEDGKLMFKGSYIEGKFTGEWEYYYENGRLMQLGSFLDGKHTGAWELYYDNGELKAVGNFLEGEKTGDWKLYTEDGKLNSIKNYVDGKETGETKVTSNQQSLSSAESKLISASMYYENANTLYKRNKKLFDRAVISKQDFDKSELSLNQATESLIQAQDDYNIILKSTATDANSFESVKIGNQVWMSKNLNISNFRNGDPIPQAKTKEEWDKAGDTYSPAWCYYENDPNNGTVLGILYNKYAVEDERGLAPLGWHIPSDEEWTELTDNLGGDEKAGIKMKSMSMWNDYNNIREKGVFEALPGGTRTRGKFQNGGKFIRNNRNGISTHWWTSTKTWYRSLTYYAEGVTRDYSSKRTGMSVRCIKD